MVIRYNDSSRWECQTILIMSRRKSRRKDDGFSFLKYMFKNVPKGLKVWMIIGWALGVVLFILGILALGRFILYGA